MFRLEDVDSLVEVSEVAVHTVHHQQGDEDLLLVLLHPGRSGVDGTVRSAGRAGHEGNAAGSRRARVRHRRHRRDDRRWVLALAAVWCFAGRFFATRPAVAKALARWGHVLLPLVLIGSHEREWSALCLKRTEERPSPQT
ncbi:hypothetical protein ACGFZK_20610 [Streptomyces sp. NPDC048257]|uniref:hypothetical protein n=1 Tax=Streptomyces sp. NPDC048257 TaxID=3365526 RepID=UPI00371944D1